MPRAAVEIADLLARAFAAEEVAAVVGDDPFVTIRWKSDNEIGNFAGLSRRDRHAGGGVAGIEALGGLRAR